MMTAMVLLAGLGVAQARTIWNGVYSDAQADRGHTMYMQNCSRCHGVNLWGTFEIPPLVGRFMLYYAGTTLDVLFDYISTAMPLDHPGALSPAANADIVAFILKSNDIPSGLEGAERQQPQDHQLRFRQATFKARAQLAARVGRD